jgi:amino acid transporter
MTTTQSQSSNPTLKSGALGFAGAATMGAVMMAPALGIYANFGPLATSAGVVAPVIFFISLVASLPTAVSYALVSREMPSSGSAYTWLWRTTRPTIGVGVGFMMALYYFIAVILQPILFGLFFNDLLAYFGVQNTGFGTWLIGFLIVTLLVGFLVYRGIQLSTHSVLIMMLIEAGVVTLLGLTIFFIKTAHGQLDFSPFNPGAALNGTNGLFAGLIFGLLSFTGYDVISTLAEETRTPRSLIPRATIAACVGVGVFWIVMSWFYTMAVPISDVAKYTTSGVTPITPIAKLYWGDANILVIITGLTAASGVYIATMVGASRVLYAMGREGSLPNLFGRLHPRFRVPWNAMHLIFALTIIVDVVWALWVGLYNAFSWWGSAIVFFALITYIFVNLSNIIFFWRFRRERFNVFLNLVVPVIGIAVGIYLLYKSFFVALWSAGWQMGQSIVVVSLALLVVVALYTLGLRAMRPKMFTSEGSPALAVGGTEVNE